MEKDGPLDTLEDILTVALDVVEDYGPGDTRIQRMAFWLVENLQAGWQGPAWVEQVVTNDPTPVSKTGPGRKMTSNEARQFAASLLRAADKAEQ